MLSRRAIISVVLSALLLCSLGYLLWRRYDSPIERNRRVAERWLDRTIDMPYEKGFTLKTAIEDLYDRIESQYRIRIGGFIHREGLTRAKVWFNSPIHYESRGLPVRQGLAEMLRTLGLGYYVEVGPYKHIIHITSLQDAAEHEAMESR